MLLLLYMVARYGIVLTLFIVLLFSSHTVLGQTIPNRSFEFQLTPQFPQAGDTVQVYAETFGFDILRANTVWKVNGKEVERGVGIRSINVLVDSSGKPITVELFAQLPRESLRKTITVRPSQLDVVIEPQTYTPVGYRGKGIITHKATVRVIALPFSKTYQAKDLIYTWKYNNQTLRSQSGVGKNTITITAPTIGRSRTLRVTAESKDGRFSGRKDITLRPQAPETLLYFVHPLLGIDYTRSLNNKSSDLLGEEVTLIAEPFYFPGTRRSTLPIEYSWKLKGVGVDSGNTDPGTLTLRSAGKGKGRADIEVSAQNKNTVPLLSDASATITFGRESKGVFGF